MEQRLDRWHGEGTSNTQPVLNTGHAINFENSEYYVEDGSFFRIRNLQLGYTFDKAWYPKSVWRLWKPISIFRTWKLGNIIPATPHEFGGSAIALVWTNGSLSGTAIYTFGLNITFWLIMKRSKYILYIWAIGGILAFTGCNDFLDRSPQGQFTEDDNPGAIGRRKDIQHLYHDA